MKALLMLVAWAGLATPALAENPRDVEQVSANALLLAAPSAAGTAAPAAPAAHAVQLTAASDNSTASAKLALGTSTDPTSASLIVKVPLNKDEDRTALWSPDQTVNGTSLELRVQHWQFQGLRAQTYDESVACIAALNKARLPGIAEIRICDLGAAQQLLDPAQYEQLRAQFLPRAAAALNYGGGVSVSYKDFTYYDPATLNKQKDRQRGAGADVFLAYQPLSSESLYIAKAEVARAYKAGTSRVACLMASTPVLNCVQGSFGAPQKELAKIVSLEYRTYLGKGTALAVQFARDLTSNTSSLQVPLYLVGNGKDSLTGGVALSYTTEDHKVGVAVFVAQAFALR